MIDIGIIIEELAINYKSTENPDEWSKGTRMLLEVKEGYYLIQPKKVRELAEELRIKTELGKLSDIMSQLGMKNQEVRIKT
jgi:hypothetical protein